MLLWNRGSFSLKQALRSNYPFQISKAEISKAEISKAKGDCDLLLVELS